MQPQQRERHPHRHLQLEMAVVLVAVRIEREDRARNPSRRVVAARQRAHEQKHRHAREHETGEQQQVVNHDGMDADPEERRAHQRRHDERVGVGERQPLGIELIRVEQRERMARQLMADPRDPPDREQRIAEVGDRVEADDLRPRQRDDERREAEQEQREFAKRDLLEQRALVEGQRIVRLLHESRETEPPEWREDPGETRRLPYEHVPDHQDDASQQERPPRRAHRDAHADDPKTQVVCEEGDGAGGKKHDGEKVGRQRFLGAFMRVRSPPLPRPHR